MARSELSGSLSLLAGIDMDGRIADPKKTTNRTNEDGSSARESELDDVDVMEKGPTLRKSFGVPAGVALISGVIIGSGIFVSPTSILRSTNAVGMALVVWIASGFLSLLAALCFIELGLMIPLSGANYPYLNRGFGPLAGFLFTWVTCLIVKPVSSAAITYAFSLYVLQPFYPGGEDEIPIWLLKLLAVLALILLSIMNCVTVNGAARFQIVFTITKVLGLILIIATGMVRLGQGYTDSFQNSFEGANYDVRGLGFAVYAGLWAYGGWSELNFSTEEIKDLNRTLPRSIIISMAMVTVLYLLTNVSYSAVLSKEEILSSGAVAVQVGEKMLGVMSWLIPLVVACSTIGSANGGIISRGRVIFAASREGHLPRMFSMLHKRFRTPVMGILLNLVLAVAFLIPKSSDFDALIGYLSFSKWLFNGLTFLALLWLRYKEPTTPRPYKVWLIVPILAFLMSLMLVIATFYKAAVATSLATLFILSGIPIYYAFVVRDMTPRCAKWTLDKVTEFFKRVLGVAFPASEAPEESNQKNNNDVRSGSTTD